MTKVTIAVRNDDNGIYFYTGEISEDEVITLKSHRFLKASRSVHSELFEKLLKSGRIQPAKYLEGELITL